MDEAQLRAQVAELQQQLESVKLNNRMLLEQARQRTMQLERLARLEGLLSQARNEEELVQAVAFSFQDNLPFIIRLSYLDLVANHPSRLAHVASWRGGAIWPDDPHLGEQLLDQVPLAQWVVEHGQTVLLVENVLTDHRLTAKERLALGEAKAVVAIPLQSGGGWQGFVTFMWHETRLFTPDEQLILRRLREPISAMVARRRAYLALEEAHQQNAVLLKRTQTSLQEARRLATITENHTDFIGVSDLEGNVLYINPAGLQMTGLNDVKTMTVIDIYPPDEARKFVEFIVPTALEKGYWLSETRMLRADGVIIPVDQTITANYDEHGKAYSFNITLRDISSRKQSEERLQANANFLQTLFDTITSPIFYKDTQGVYLGCNKAFATYLGLSEKEIIGKTVYDLSPPHFAARYHQMDEELLQTCKEQVYEAKIVDAQGQILEVIFNKNVFYDAEGKVAGLVGVMVDITSRKQAEEQIRQTLRQNNLLASAINNADIGITISDPYQPDNPLVFVNPAFTKITGYSAEEVLGTNCRFLQGPETDPEVVREMRQAIQNQHSCTVQLLNYRKDGTPFWNRLIINPILGAEGKLINYIGVQADITDLKAAEAVQRRLSAIVETTTDFVGIADVQGRVLYVNPAGRAMVGIDPDFDVTQLQVNEFHPQWVIDLLFEEAFPLASEGKVWQKEAALLTRDKQEIPISQVLVAQFHDNGSVEFFATIGRDIAQVKLAEAEQKRLLEEVEAAYRQYVRHEWEHFLTERQQLLQTVVYEHQERSAEIGTDLLASIQRKVLDEGQTQVVAADPNIGQGVVTPITLRGQIIGTLSLQDDVSRQEWTANELTLIEAVSEQLALTLENLRLFEETQQRAARERLITEMTQQVWASGELELVMQTAVEQLGQKLEASKVVLYLGTEDELI